MPNPVNPETRILRIEIRGEQIRNLMALRLKEYDRNVERIEQARLVAVADAERADADVAGRFEQVRGRAPMVGRRDDVESIGLSSMYSAKQQVDRLTNAIEHFKFQRAQVAWLAEQFNRDQSYVLGADDLTLLGLAAGRAGMGYGFDPLDL